MVQHPTWNTNQRARMHQKLNSDVCRGCQKVERNNGIAKEEMKEALVSRQALHVRRLAREGCQSRTQDTYANGRDSGQSSWWKEANCEEQMRNAWRQLISVNRGKEANLVHHKAWATNQRARMYQKFNSDLVCQQTPKICLSIHTHPQLLYIV